MENVKSKSPIKITTDNVKLKPQVKHSEQYNYKLEKQKKLEELQLKVREMRQARIQKHAVRVQLLKTMNLNKYDNNSSQLSNLKTYDADTSKLLASNSKTILTDEATKKVTKGAIITSQATKPTFCSFGKSRNITTESVASNRKSIIPRLNLSSSVKGASNTILPIRNNITQSFGIQTKNGSVHAAEPDAVKVKNASVSRKVDISAIERLSKPRTVTKPYSAPVNNDSKKKIVQNNSNIPDKLPAQNKRWTMASIDRLSKPKIITKPSSHDFKTNVSDIPRRTISAPLNHTVVLKPKPDNKKKSEIYKPDGAKQAVLRRSLSTVHIKHMGPNAAKKCLKRTFSVGNMKNKEFQNVSEIFPTDCVLPVASERKKSVKFLTPLRMGSTPSFLNTPKPSELRKRLNDWLQKRGKSLSTYHHLQCFGIHGFKADDKAPLPIDPLIDDDNKENEEIEDDDSFNENMTGQVKDVAAEWRRASYHLIESPSIPRKSPATESSPQVLRELTPETRDDSYIVPISVAALNDLHHLILEGYSWHQCAEWLRAVVRTCGEAVTNSAPYWECRAALEEKRGDFPRAVECYNKAIQQGAQPSDVEVSLDHLLEKFMKLNLDPYSEKHSQQMVDPKLLDVKNVFKSTLIRFAIQQKNIKEKSNENTDTDSPKFIATPVRRSSRLTLLPEASSRNIDTPISHRILNLPKTNVTLNENDLKGKGRLHESTKSKVLTPKISAKKSTGRKHLVQLCTSLKNVDEGIKQSLIFVPNKALTFDDGL